MIHVAAQWSDQDDSDQIAELSYSETWLISTHCVSFVSNADETISHLIWELLPSVDQTGLTEAHPSQ